MPNLTREKAYEWAQECSTIIEGVCDCGRDHSGRLVEIYAPDAGGLPVPVLALCEKCAPSQFRAAQSQDDAHRMARATHKLAEARRAANRVSHREALESAPVLTDEERWEDEWNEYGDAMVA